MLVSIGVDIGTKNGAIAIIDENFNILFLSKAPYVEIDMAHTTKNRVTPKLNKETGKYEITYKKRTWTDYTQFRNLFSSYVNQDNSIIYTLEKVSVRPGEGEISSFIFGNSLGCFQGLSSYLNPVKIYEPTPQLWKKEMGVTSDKATSVKLVTSIFDINLRDYVKRGKIDDIAESLLLAVYGLLQYNKESNEGK